MSVVGKAFITSKQKLTNDDLHTAFAFGWKVQLVA